MNQSIVNKLLIDLDMNDLSNELSGIEINEVKVDKMSKAWEISIDVNEMIDINYLWVFCSKVSSFFSDVKISYAYHYNFNIESELIYQYFRYFASVVTSSDAILNILLNRELDYDFDNEELRIFVFNDFEHESIHDELMNIESIFGQFGIAIDIGSITINHDVELSSLEEFATPAVKKEESGLIYGTKDTKVNCLISNIESGMNSICIKGTIFEINTFLTRNKKYVITIYITDKQDSLIAKLFLDENDAALSKILAAKNSNVKMFGHITFDQYESTDIMRVESIVILPNDEVYETMENKRVELHTHTTMSQVDSMIDPKSLIDFCVHNGYSAVGVVDHNSVQSFPTLYNYAMGKDIKVVYGAELNVVDDKVDLVFNNIPDLDFKAEFVVFDFETTGLNPSNDKIIEFGAVKIKNGEIIDEFSKLCNPGVEISSKITEITKISNSMLKNSPSEEEVLKEFAEWIGNLPIVAHNAKFDYGFLDNAYNRFNLGLLTNPVIDTLEISRVLHPEWGRHGLAALTNRYKVELNNHHRACDDARATAMIFSKQLIEISEKNIFNVKDINSLVNTDEIYKFGKINHLTVIVLNNVGLKNLFKLISLANTKYFYKVPRLLKSEIANYREGLLVGSSCVNGEVFSNAKTMSELELMNVMKFYDYIEVQPPEVYSFLVQTGEYASEIEIMSNIKHIVNTAMKLEKLVVASGDVHHISKDDKILREIVINNPIPGGGFHPLKNNRISNLPSQHFLNTSEMLNAFDFLDISVVEDLVINNPRKIVDMVGVVEVIKRDLYTPKMENSSSKTSDLVYDTAYKMYGNNLPEIVEKRIEKELDSIIGNGFDVVYLISYELVKKSVDDGYLVGSRGSVGSSFVATLMGITEVNPLAPHYLCKKCTYSEFIEDDSYASGFDLEEKACPKCGEIMKGDGQDIPFETFLGFKGDKVPDIDLNFSGDYQAIAHNYTKELFGEEFVYRAGTISTIAEKTAYGYVKGYESEVMKSFNKAEISRLALGCQGVKRGTGQHPGGILVIPNHMDVYDFTPIQYPADDISSSWYTTHLDFHAIHDNVLKLDILGHDDPTVLHMLNEISGINPTTVDFTHQNVISIFSGPDILNVKKRDIRLQNGNTYTLFPTGTLGVPEFGTRFVMEMLNDTKPKSYSELVKISGLSHGTDVWLNNGQALIRNNVCEFKDVIGCRDDIMVFLMHKGIDSSTAFKIMEDVRKGKGLTNEYVEVMRENDVPEWYIDSCNKIKYMFPKAHAAAYVLMALRIAYFKVFHPIYYYAAYFSIRASDFDISTMILGKDAVYDKIVELVNKESMTPKEKNVLGVLEIALEMLERGFEFKNISLDTSDATKFIVDGNSLIPPFASIEGLGDSVAKNLVNERNNQEFRSIEDLKNRGKINKTILTRLEIMDVLEYLPEGDQLSLF